EFRLGVERIIHILSALETTHPLTCFAELKEGKSEATRSAALNQLATFAKSARGERPSPLKLIAADTRSEELHPILHGFSHIDRLLGELREGADPQAATAYLQAQAQTDFEKRLKLDRFFEVLGENCLELNKLIEKNEKIGTPMGL